MLFFELFPAFMAIVALVAGIWLFILNREADEEERFAGREQGAADRQRADAA